MLANIIGGLVLVIILSLAIWYIRKESKKGIKCVGCPYAKGCSGQGSCGSKGTSSKNKK